MNGKRARATTTQGFEPFVASAEDKAELIQRALQWLKTTGAPEARARRLFELVVEDPAAFDAVLLALGERFTYTPACRPENNCQIF